MDAIYALRHQLHRHPELSGEEATTAETVTRFFQDLNPDTVITGLGGYGLAFVFNGAQPGPTVLLRCELDALPIQERHDHTVVSSCPGVGHQCGHDGHMAILAAVATQLSTQRPTRGRVVLLYQPAEETGQGAAAVIADPRFADIRPDFVFALHNVPGFPLGQVVTREGSFSSASRGMAVQFHGRTAHAAQPETGISPAPAMCQLIQNLTTLPFGFIPEGETAFATVVGAQLGTKAFGTAPGHAEVWATLRSETDETMARLVKHSEQCAQASASQYDLSVTIEYEDIFPATINAAEAVAIIKTAAGKEPVHTPAKPFRWSEDFGHFTTLAPGAMFGIGAGDNTADLHNPDYQFPEALIPIAANLFIRIIQQCLG